MFTELWSIKMSDWQRGLVVAILTTPIGIVYDWAMGEGLVINWRSVVKGAIAGGLAYIGKNLITGSSGKLLTNKKEGL